MESLFNDIQNRIAGNLPQLSLIDEDYGQLEAIETAEDTYPVTFPCVLINIPETEWSNLGGGSQRGNTTVIIRLAIDCYDDTHYGSGTEQKAAERLQLAQSVHRLAQGFKPTGASPLIRRSSRFYSRPHAIKVYEMSYNCMVDDLIPRP
jgi:hypothetical protein